MTHSGRFTPENPEQRVTLSLQSPLMGCLLYTSKLSMKNKNMKKIYIHKIHLILCFTSVLCFGLPINAQKSAKNGTTDNNKKAWEIGIGATEMCIRDRYKYAHSSCHLPNS